MIAWLQLARISLLPSALANILMGYLVVHLSWNPALDLGLLLGATACFYSAGMILNDVFDVGEDTKLRPNRPIPALSLIHI